MKKKHPVFTDSDCVNCGICVQACPLSCLRLTRTGIQKKYKNVFPELVSDKCTGCGICASSCPMDCITMRELPDETAQ